MGKGDKKTAKGKRSMGSYGNTRKRKENKPVVIAAKPKKEKKSYLELPFSN
jgi:ribosomal small subunit protein bTHX